MDRMEQNHEQVTRDLASLTGTVTRVELNQTHADELNKVRFASLDRSVEGVSGKLDAFMSRIEGIITGEIQLPMAREYDERRKDLAAWRDGVDGRLDGHDKFETQARLLGRLAIVLLTTNVISVVVAAIAFVRG